MGLFFANGLNCIASGIGRQHIKTMRTQQHCCQFGHCNIVVYAENFHVAIMLDKSLDLLCNLLTECLLEFRDICMDGKVTIYE